MIHDGHENITATSTTWEPCCFILMENCSTSFGSSIYKFYTNKTKIYQRRLSK